MEKSKDRSLRQLISNAIQWSCRRLQSFGVTSQSEATRRPDHSSQNYANLLFLTVANPPAPGLKSLHRFVPTGVPPCSSKP
jgi:hypothetical protein